MSHAQYLEWAMRNQKFLFSTAVKVFGKELEHRLGFDDYFYWMPLAIDSELLLYYGKTKGWDEKYKKKYTLDETDYRDVQRFAEYVKGFIYDEIEVPTDMLLEKFKSLTIGDVFYAQKNLFASYPDEYDITDEEVEAVEKSFKNRSLYDFAVEKCKNKLTYEFVRNLKHVYKDQLEFFDDELKDYYYNEW